MKLTKAQERLKKKHGAPDEFEKACCRAVPGDISWSEAVKAIKKYQREWEVAGKKK